MGCLQDKNQQQVVQYENSMGQQYASMSGKDIQNMQVVVMGVTQDNQERIFSYDAVTQKFKALVVPQGMTIWNYSSIVHISNKDIFVTGGLSSSASEISNQAYIYDSISGKAIRLPNMMFPRYTHISIFFKGKLYAIGGRDYGDDDSSAIRTQCERFNFFMHRWEKTTRLNFPRCTGFAMVYKDSIYVCGGLTGKLHRSRTIERYDESNDRWVVLDFKLSRGMECGTLFSASYFLPAGQAKDKFIIIGGNTEEGSQDTSYIYNMSDQSVISAPFMNQRRVLQKSIAYNNKVYVFGGSETDGVEIFDQNSSSWKEDKTQSFSVFVSPQDIDLFSYSQPPVTIPDELPIVHKMTSVITAAQVKKINEASVNNDSADASQSSVNQSKSQDEQNDHTKTNTGLKISNGQSRANTGKHLEAELSSITKSLIKEDLLIEKSYLFGTDIDPFIMEIDYLNVKVEKKSVPLQIRLFQYQGVASIKEKNIILLMGGVHDGMNKSVKYTYTFDPSNFKGKRVENMLVPSYAFATLTQYPYVYAIGGKQSIDHKQQNNQYYQNNNTQNSIILNTCQRYDIETGKWEKLPNLNVKRVSAMAAYLHGKIYVFGGFKGDLEQVRPNEIEVYNPSQPFKDHKNQPAWEVISVKFPIGLEGAPILEVNQIGQNTQPDLLLFGGRTSSGEIRYISKLSFNVEAPEQSEVRQSQGEEEEQEPVISVKLDKISQMLQTRCLHKVIQPYQQYALVLGGQFEPYVECIHLKDYLASQMSNVPHIDLIVQKLTQTLKKVKDHSLKQYSFTSI